GRTIRERNRDQKGFLVHGWYWVLRSNWPNAEADSSSGDAAPGPPTTTSRSAYAMAPTANASATASSLLTPHVPWPTRRGPAAGVQSGGANPRTVNSRVIHSATARARRGVCRHHEPTSRPPSVPAHPPGAVGAPRPAAVPGSHGAPAAPAPHGRTFATPGRVA